MIDFMHILKYDYHTVVHVKFNKRRKGSAQFSNRNLEIQEEGIHQVEMDSQEIHTTNINA